MLATEEAALQWGLGTGLEGPFYSTRDMLLAFVWRGTPRRGMRETEMDWKERLKTPKVISWGAHGTPHSACLNTGTFFAVLNKKSYVEVGGGCVR